MLSTPRTISIAASVASEIQVSGWVQISSIGDVLPQTEAEDIPVGHPHHLAPLLQHLEVGERLARR